MTKDEFVKIYKVGDKIRMAHWTCSRFSEILYIGNVRFFARSEDSNEYSYPYNYCAWIPYTEPKKKVKMSQAVYKWRGLSQTHQISSLFLNQKKKLKQIYRLK